MAYHGIGKSVNANFNASLHNPIVWPNTMTKMQMVILLILPLISFLLICFYLWLTPISIEYQKLHRSGNETTNNEEKERERKRSENYLQKLSKSNRNEENDYIIPTIAKLKESFELQQVQAPLHKNISGNSKTYHTMHTTSHKKSTDTKPLGEKHSHIVSSSAPRLSRSFIEEGEISGDYSLHWKCTFDYYFLLFMIFVFIFLIGYTYIFYSKEFRSFDFWIVQWMKLGLMMSVSCIGGLICRYFSVVDAEGYILTNKNSMFKVNYTRKLQHFAAYIIPLVIKPYDEATTNFITVLWGDYFTLLNFLLLIKPIRESCTFFMLQFNSLDRPEDRPHTLKWIIAGNIIPGFIILLFFHWLFSPNYTSLLYIIIFITGIGDGLAEPIGVTWGRHKYKIKNWFSEKKYTRSLEGSTCVFMSGMIFPALQYYDFNNFYEVLLNMIVLAPAMAYAEATAPHTLDTPVLMIGCGTILYAITSLI